jgi:hypothetical protein
MAVALVRVNDLDPVACDHPRCEQVIERMDLCYPARLRDNIYCSVLCRNRHSKCISQYNRRQDPAKYLRDRQKKVERKYGITTEDFDLIFTFQNGACAICDLVLEGAKICVDHDHDTGEVRGLLCAPCNAGIGFFKDDPERLRRAARYVNTPTAPQVLSASPDRR